mmetsp:Transcript_34165/g.66161  ORF Transcript_34165/g.66161 Transcript_34165/m.66161 type:complete len:209 (-) Transcript_34165:92-718(-)
MSFRLLVDVAPLHGEGLHVLVRLELADAGGVVHLPGERLGDIEQQVQPVDRRSYLLLYRHVVRTSLAWFHVVAQVENSMSDVVVDGVNSGVAERTKLEVVQLRYSHDTVLRHHEHRPQILRGVDFVDHLLWRPLCLWRFLLHAEHQTTLLSLRRKVWQSFNERRKGHVQRRVQLLLVLITRVERNELADRFHRKPRGRLRLKDLLHLP